MTKSPPQNDSNKHPAGSSADRADLRSDRGGLWQDAFRRLRCRRFALAALVVILVYFGLAVAVWLSGFFGVDIPLFRWSQPVGASYEKPLLLNRPSSGRGDVSIQRTDSIKDGTGSNRNGRFFITRLCGTDILGLSTLRKTIYATGTSIGVAALASVISVFVGVVLGAVAGYYRGFIDRLVIWLYSTLSAVPWILLVMAFAVVLENRVVAGIRLEGFAGLCLALGLTGWVGLCRLVRSEVIKLKQCDYVLAARSVGCSDIRILLVHILPGVFYLVIVNLTLRFVHFIHIEVVMSFLGLGDNDKPTWGAMINAARTELSNDVWWEMASAIAAVFFISLALNIFGDALRDSLDPRLKGAEFTV